MRGSAIHRYRSQWQSQWDRRNFAPLPVPNTCTNLDAASAQGVDVPNLIKIDTAVAALRMREKTPFRVGFYSATQLCYSGVLGVVILSVRLSVTRVLCD